MIHRTRFQLLSFFFYSPPELKSVIRYAGLGSRSLLHVDGGGGTNGPVPFADICGGRLICPLPLGARAAVVAAQLSLHKRGKIYMQTRAGRTRRAQPAAAA